MTILKFCFLLTIFQIFESKLKISYLNNSSVTNPNKRLSNKHLYAFNKDILNRLTELCRIARQENKPNCFALRSNIFTKFLKIIYSFIDFDKREISTVKKSWNQNCKQLVELGDNRTHPICSAASFAYIPFNLSHKYESKKMLLPGRSQLKIGSGDNANFDLIVVTVNTNHKSMHSKMLRSACKNRIDVIVLTERPKKKILKEFQFGVKLLLLRKYIHHIYLSNKNKMNALEKKIILFVDATDVIFQANKDKIIQSFLATNATILFSAEHACFPFSLSPWSLNLDSNKSCISTGDANSMCSNHRYICNKLYPDVPLNVLDKGNRWLNSGGFIGYFNSLHTLLESTRYIPDDMISSWPGTDQGLYSHLFLSNTFPIMLDYHSVIFQSWGLIKNINNNKEEEGAVIDIHQGRTTETLVRFDPYSKLWINSYTNAIPPILHFNADGKRFMKHVISSQNYLQLSSLFFSFSYPFCSFIHKVIYGEDLLT